MTKNCASFGPYNCYCHMDYQIFCLVLPGHCSNFQLDFSELTIVSRLSYRNCLDDYNERCCSSFACPGNDLRTPNHFASYVYCYFASKIQHPDDPFWIDSCFSANCSICCSLQSFERQIFQFWTGRTHKQTSRQCGQLTACSAKECSPLPSLPEPPHSKALD